MYECIKCKKKFKYESKLNEHKNRKIPCNQSKRDLNCTLCNSKFKYESDYLRHEKTKKHINAINNVNQSNVNGDNNINNSFNNIIQLTLNVNSFKNTDK